jgi:hypothetical protein
MKRTYHRIEALSAEAKPEDQIAELFETIGNRQYEWLLITCETIFPFEATIHSDQESLIHDLGNALTCGHCVEAIFHQGSRLSEEQQKELELQAIKLLGPISRAMAEGKFNQ